MRRWSARRGATRAATWRSPGRGRGGRRARAPLSADPVVSRGRGGLVAGFLVAQGLRGLRILLLCLVPRRVRWQVARRAQPFWPLLAAARLTASFKQALVEHHAQNERDRVSAEQL